MACESKGLSPTPPSPDEPSGGTACGPQPRQVPRAPFPSEDSPGGPTAKHSASTCHVRARPTKPRVTTSNSSGSCGAVEESRGTSQAIDDESQASGDNGGDNGDDKGDDSDDGDDDFEHPRVTMTAGGAEHDALRSLVNLGAFREAEFMGRGSRGIRRIAGFCICSLEYVDVDLATFVDGPYSRDDMAAYRVYGETPTRKRYRLVLAVVGGKCVLMGFMWLGLPRDDPQDGLVYEFRSGRAALQADFTKTGIPATGLALVSDTEAKKD